MAVGTLIIFLSQYFKNDKDTSHIVDCVVSRVEITVSPRNPCVFTLSNIHTEICALAYRLKILQIRIHC